MKPNAKTPIKATESVRYGVHFFCPVKTKYAATTIMTGKMMTTLDLVKAASIQSTSDNARYPARARVLSTSRLLSQHKTAPSSESKSSGPASPDT